MKTNHTVRACESAGATLPAPRVLVVDDEAPIRHLSMAVLVHHGYEVDDAEDGSAAWEVLCAGSYDLLITDNHMPGLTGVELLKKLRAARMVLPVIMVTGAFPAQEFAGRPWLRPDATLLKPFTGDELLEMVNKVLHAPDGAPEQTGLIPDWRSAGDSAERFKVPVTLLKTEAVFRR